MTWISAGLSGLLGAAVNVMLQQRALVRREGIVDEKLRAHDARLEKHGLQIDDVRRDVAGQGERLAAVESRCETFAHRPRGGRE